MNSDKRPAVDFSVLSHGSLKRYESLYGVQVSDPKNLTTEIRDHFGMTVYSVMKSTEDPKTPTYKPQTDVAVRLDSFKTEYRTPEEVIDMFIKIKKDDKDEHGIGRARRATTKKV